MTTTSYFINLAPGCDTQFMLNLYRQLLDALQIPNQIITAPAAGPAHPIEEVNTRLTRQYLEHMQVFKAMALSKVNLEVVSSHISADSIILMFSYQEPS